MGDVKWEAGQEVTVTTHIGHSYRFHKVARVLKRFIELDDGSKWSHGGDPYPRRNDVFIGSRPFVRLTTYEDRQAAQRMRCVETLERLRSSGGREPWKAFDADALEAVVDMLDAQQTERRVG